MPIKSKVRSVQTFFVTLVLNKRKLYYVGDERMAQIMREVAEDARESTRRAAERVAAGIEAASLEARARVEETLNRLRNGSK